MPKIINYTDHVVRILHRGTMDIKETFPKSGIETRIEVQVENKYRIGSVDICGATSWRIVNEPPPEEGILYIVSLRCKQMMPWRKDLLVPLAIKYDNGKPYGCYRLSDTIDSDLMIEELRMAA